MCIILILLPLCNLRQKPGRFFFFLFFGNSFPLSALNNGPSQAISNNILVVVFYLISLHYRLVPLNLSSVRTPE